MDLYQPISATTSSQISSQPTAPVGNTITPKQTVPVLPPAPAPTTSAPIKGSGLAKTLVSLPSPNKPALASTIRNAVINSAILPTTTFVSPTAPVFIPLNASTILDAITPVLTTSTIICDYLQAGVEISTSLLSLDQAFLTANKTELLLNGIPLATIENLSSIADWALDPAISTIDANMNDIINAKNIYGSDFIGNTLNVNQAFISDLTVYQQTTENFASTFTIEARDIFCSTISVNDDVVGNRGVFSSINVSSFNARNLVAENLFGSNTNVSSINGTQYTAGADWSKYVALCNVVMDGNSIVSGSNKSLSIAGDTGLTMLTSNGDISIVAPNDNILTNYAVNMRGGDVNIKASEGARLDLFSDVNITAENGNRGRVNITANGGFNNGVNGEVNLVANGSSSPLGVGAGGLISLTANTPVGFSNLTSAIKLSASGINIYAGFIPSIGSVAGYNFIYGLGGNVISAGNPPIFPSVPGTNYLWGEFGTSIVNDFYTDRIFPYWGGLTTPPDLQISGRYIIPNLAQVCVRLSNVRYLDFQSNVATRITNVDTITMSNGTLTGVSQINGVAYPPPLPTTLNGVNAINMITGSITGLNTINGSPYVPGGGGSVISTVATASISSLTVSSINGVAYTPGGSGTNSFSTINISTVNNYVSFQQDPLSEAKGLQIYGGLPFIQLSNTTGQQTVLNIVADDNNTLIETYNSNATPLNMIFKADNFGFNVENITGGIEFDISGNTEIRNGSLTVSTIQGIQSITGLIENPGTSNVYDKFIDMTYSAPGAFGGAEISIKGENNASSPPSIVRNTMGVDLQTGESYFWSVWDGYISMPFKYYGSRFTFESDTETLLHLDGNAGSPGFISSAVVMYSPQVDTPALTNISTFNGTPVQVFGEFLTTTTITVSGANTPTRIPFDTNTVGNGVSLNSGEIEVLHNGLFKLNLSIQFDKSGGGTDSCDFWIQNNGFDVANTASQITITGTSAETIGTVSLMFSAIAGDKISVLFASSDPTMSATYFPAWVVGIDPYQRPAIPAVIANIQLLR